MIITVTMIMSLILCFLLGMLWGESIGERLAMNVLEEEAEKEKNNMRIIKEKFKIPKCDYDELNSENGRWTKDQYAYWVAKFKSMYPVEGYGMYHVYTSQEDDGYCYIGWDHYDSCD